MTIPAIEVPNHYVVADPNVLGGTAVVRGSKVPVYRLWDWHRRGVTVETLVKRYPALGPANVLGALAFAYENQEHLNAEIARAAQILDAAEARR